MDDAMDFTWTDVDLSVQNEINKEFEQYRNQQVINWNTSMNQSININTNSGKISLYDFFIIVDTNILLDKQKFLSDLFQFPREYKVAIIIPWIVIQELDGLKNSTKLMDNNISLSKLARSALSLILKYTVDENSNLIGQKYNEVLNVGNPMFSKNDDKILDCCLYFRQNYGKEVFLLSNDKALCVKSVFSNIKVIERWEDSAEAFIMHITSIDENKAQNIANSVTSSTPPLQNNSSNNNNNENMNSTFKFNYNKVSLPKNNKAFSRFKDYNFGEKNKSTTNYNNYNDFNFDFEIPIEGYSSVNDHEKFMKEFEKSYNQNKNSNNGIKFNFNSNINNNNSKNKNNQKNRNNNNFKKNLNTKNDTIPKTLEKNDPFDDLLNYSCSSENDHKKLMEDYERSLKEENDSKEDNESKNISNKRKHELDNLTEINDNNSLLNSNNNTLLNRRIINPTRRLKQKNTSNESVNSNINNSQFNKIQYPENISFNSNQIYENKAKKIKTNIQSPSSNNTISVNSHNMTMNIHNTNNNATNSLKINIHSTNRMNSFNIHSTVNSNTIQNNKMAIETKNTSKSCTLQLIRIVENYLSNGLKKFVDNKVKKNKPIPNTIPYIFPTKINDLFSLIINSWDFFKEGYPSFYGNEPLIKTVETKSLIDGYKTQNKELTENELLKIYRNLEQILEICEGLEGREVSIQRRKELKNIKENIKNMN
ncbi:hypothetical protein BCR36DRAFT_363121 [Piromyces finnis]|uniref:PIN domain-containing protein n=1 Tax=Piromyces finnis TaxID=1754191 RepID=A0A1Y1UWP2_9FUNG|nr:hypothetical protein BCR36DRAFT_363121 [Piromyces finnis]|eukprot:ORX42046.1 hypothetical protein BCR36DRAFT_363121 [Piromyces finnis]